MDVYLPVLASTHPLIEFDMSDHQLLVVKALRPCRSEDRLRHFPVSPPVPSSPTRPLTKGFRFYRAPEVLMTWQSYSKALDIWGGEPRLASCHGIQLLAHTCSCLLACLPLLACSGLHLRGDAQPCPWLHYVRSGRAGRTTTSALLPVPGHNTC